MSNTTEKSIKDKDGQLEKLTQSFLRKIKELEASPGKRDNLKEEIREIIAREKF
jgi:hypothetical protein